MKCTCCVATCYENVTAKVTLPCFVYTSETYLAVCLLEQAIFGIRLGDAVF